MLSLGPVPVFCVPSVDDKIGGQEQTGSADGKTAYAPQFERPYESPVPPFAERVMWKNPTLQPAKLKSSWGYGLWLGRSQTSNAHLIGTRVGIVVARTIRRLPASEREDSNLVVAMRGTPVARRPADAAAGDAPTVARHAVEHREVVVVPASSGAPQRRRRQRIFKSSSKPAYADSCEGTTIIGCNGK